MAKSSPRRVTSYINGKEEDASGWQTFSYGKLGEVTENIRTFALPFEPKPYTFRMKYKYDSFNRMQQMTYPDGEKVSYGYNLGGMLNDIKGDKNGQTYPYVNHIAYNQYELKDTVWSGNGTLATYEWDHAGNMTMHRLHDECTRRLCWDEQNRLLGVSDKKYLSYYQYDANGDRIYKLTGEFARQNRNGEWRYYYYLKRPTLYASPYLVTNPKGYTKHYYAENERIASRMGGGGLYEIDRNDNPEMFVTHKERSIKLFAEVMECLETQAEVPESLLKFLYEWKDIREEEKECYWYHPDHLGSSSWITFSDGKAVEHLHYMPWGEDFVRQRSTDWHDMYTFSAKEKDAETGYSYFGSWYYSSNLSIWLSVDPMSDSLPYMTPFNYCKNSPILMKDPNGEFPWLVVWGLVEAGLAVYDAYQTGTTIVDPNASIGQKAASVGGFLLGAILPGGGYGSGAKFGVKQAERLIKAGVTTGKRIDNVGGFASRELLKEHYIKHGKEFGGKFKNADEYLKGTQNFFKRESSDIVQYTRKNGDIVRYDMKNNIFGVADKNGNIRTMFKPDDGINFLKKQIKTDLGIDGL